MQLIIKLAFAILSVQCSYVFKSGDDLGNGSESIIQQNSTLDKELDRMLLKLEKSVKDRNLETFQKFFHDEFDAQAWFLRYYAQLTEAQLDSFVIRRFGYVESYEKDYKLKISESRIIGDNDFLLRSFIVLTKRMPEQPYAIVSLTQYGEY